MKEKVLSILNDIRPDIEFEKEERLIDDGMLDSFDIISIVSDFNNEFDIEIEIDELEPYNFNTVAAMVELIEKLRDEA